MKTIPLAKVPSPRPLSRRALERHLDDVRVPARTAMLLGDLSSAGEAADRAADLGVGAAVHDALGALVGHLSSGVDDGDPHEVHRNVGSLAGLGPGLTPTGDDILVALVATSGRLADGGLLRRGAADRLAAAVAAIPEGRTTAVAHRLLSETARGLYPEPLASFVGALGDPTVDGEALAGLVARLTATGAHSGADWLAGALALARASVIQPRHSRPSLRAGLADAPGQGGDRWPSA